MISLKLPAHTLLQKLFILLFLGVIITSGVLFYFYQQTQAELKKLKEDPQVLTREETEKLVADIGKLMRLPAGEEPTVATVTDAKRLQNQTFFKEAMNGDKVLFYAQAKKAVLYRPTENVIIEVARVNNEQAQPIRVAIYNGSTNTAALNDFAKTIKEKVTRVDIVTRQNAKRRNYTGTLIVDVSGQNAQTAQELAQVLGGSVGSLPAGEVRPTDAEYLIIVGETPTPQPTRR